MDMSFNISTVDGILVHRSDGSDFNEEGLVLTGAGTVSISQDAGTATFTISGAAEAALEVKDDNVTVVSDASSFDFGHALDVTDNSGEAEIAVSESEFTTVVFLTGAQTISGAKTFADNMVVEGDLTVNGTTTTLNTEELLVEDNIITLNSTVTGTPTLDAGLSVERGTETDAELRWDESADYWTAGISGSTERILLESDLTNIDADIATVSGLTVTNASDISDNAADIATVSGLTVTNASDIADIATVSGLTVTNASDISDNAADIATVSGLTVTNASDITSLSGYVGSNFLMLDGSNDPLTGNLDLASGVDILNAASGVNDLGAAANPFAELHVDQGFNYSAPTLDNHIANKAYVDSQVAGATIVVEDDNVSVVSSASTLNFSTGLDVSDAGSGQADITINESELSTVVFLTGDQTVSGVKTFDSPVITASGATPASGTAAGSEGEIRWSDDYLYIAVADSVWKRTPLATF
jgi:hypothetical protein